jgi:hypothetical protein
LRGYFRKVDTENGRIRLNDDEIIFHDRSSAIAEAKKRAGIPEGLKPVDAWEVGRDEKLAEIAKQNQYNNPNGDALPTYTLNSDKSAWGRYEVFEFFEKGVKVRRVIVDHIADTNNPLRHIHSGWYRTNLPKNQLRAERYEAIEGMHHLAYQEVQ